MGDLISRSALLKHMEETEISQYIDELNNGNDNYSSTPLYDFVKDMPTAYSVEDVVAEMNKLINEELHSVLKPLPDGTEYPEEAYRLLYLNTRLRGLIRNGGKE